MRIHVLHIATLAAATLASPLATSAANAATPVSAMAAIDCASASTTLMTMTMPSIAATGNVDRDYLAQTKAHAAMDMNMARIEMACGTNAAAKKAAREAMERDEQVSSAIDFAIHVAP